MNKECEHVWGLGFPLDICKKCGISSKGVKKPQPVAGEASNPTELLCASDDPVKLRIALRWLLDASKPYLRRKKMTPRNDCAALNAIHEECEKLLST